MKRGHMRAGKRKLTQTESRLPFRRQMIARISGSREVERKRTQRHTFRSLSLSLTHEHFSPFAVCRRLSTSYAKKDAPHDCPCFTLLSRLISATVMTASQTHTRPLRTSSALVLLPFTRDPSLAAAADLRWRKDLGEAAIHLSSSSLRSLPLYLPLNPLACLPCRSPCHVSR